MAHSHLASVTAKGQFVIPAELRRRHHIRKGTRVRIEEVKEGILLRPITDEYIDSLGGNLAGRGLPTDMKREPDPDRGGM